MQSEHERQLQRLVLFYGVHGIVSKLSEIMDQKCREFPTFGAENTTAKYAEVLRTADVEMSALDNQTESKRNNHAG